MKLLIVAAVIGLLYVISNRINKLQQGDDKPSEPDGPR
jgi:hypothetical protein